MPEPFKNLFNDALIDLVAKNLMRVAPDFDADGFCLRAKSGLADLEMMARSDQISCALDGALTGDYPNQINTLVAALHPSKTSELSEMKSDETGIAGWAITSLGGFVVRNGMGDPEISLHALKEMTKRFSTEFAVRPFLENHQNLALRHVAEWAKDENHHVRRLASEGTRPLLPWGIKLHEFVCDPSAMSPILMSLRDDPSDYVRKSVANHINDISKNHPDLVAQLAHDWLEDAPRPREKLVKHACRGLIKAGHARTLAAFGYAAPDVSDVKLTMPQVVNLGEQMPFQLCFTSNAKQNLLIDYVLYFMRANGKLSTKVFKWIELKVASGECMELQKSHPYKIVTTRKDYPGRQVLAVQINGIEIARAEFDFLL